MRSPRAASRATGCRMRRVGCMGSGGISQPRGRQPGSLRIWYRAGGRDARSSCLTRSISNPEHRTGAAGQPAGTRSYALRLLPISLQATYRGARSPIWAQPFDKLRTALVEARFDELSAHLISPGQSRMPSFQSNEPVLVVGRDIHRHAFARDAVDRLRTAGVDVLVVDMGWPSDDRRYADVATFGASALMGRALLTWLGLGGD